jgi:hypothetical protein
MAISALVGIAATATATVMLGTFGAAAIAIGIGAAGLMSYALDSMMEDVAVDTMSNRNTSSKATVAPRQVVYGKCRTGGVIVYENTSADFADTEGDHAYLHQFVVFSEGECESIEKVFFDETVCAERDSGGTLRYKNQYKKSQGTDTVGNHVLLDLSKLGTDTQTAITGSQSAAVDTSGVIPSEWTSNHKLLGVCYLYAQMHHEPEVYDGKTPRISALIKGKKIYNPTYDSSESDWQVGANSGHSKTDSSTWEWSDNPVLILLDYMMNEDYGLGESLDSFNAASAKEALAYCDQLINLHPSGQEKRFTCNGIVTADNSHRKNIENILSSMNGQLLYSNGQYHIKAYKFEAVNPQVVNEDILINEFDVVTKSSRRDLYNVVRGKFVAEEHDYQMTEYPQQTSGLKDSDNPALGNEYEYDDGETLPLEYDLPMTTSNTMAQRLAYLLLLRSRLQATVKFETNLKGLVYTVGDNIYVTNASIGYSNKLFQITSLTVAPDLKKGISVKIEAQENNQGIYNWQANTATDFTTQGTVSIGELTVEPPTNLSVVPSLVNIGDDRKMNWDISFDASNDALLSHYVLKHRHLNDLELQTINLGKSTTASLPDRDNGEEYLVEVRAVNINGVESDSIQGFFSFTLPEAINPSFAIVEQTTLTEPTTQQMTDALGRAPVSGDVINLVQVDADGVPIDGIRYIFEPEMTSQYTDVDNYAKLSNVSTAAFLKFDVTYREKNVTPTFSFAKIDDSTFNKNYGDTTDFEGVSFTTNTANGYTVARFIVQQTQAEHDTEYLANGTVQTEQKGNMRITATHGVNTSTVDVFIFNSITHAA